MMALKTYTLTETDPTYVADFMSAFGKDLTMLTPTKFTTEIDLGFIHGIREVVAAEELDSAVDAFLRGYTGYSGFIKSVRDQLVAGRQLSPKQIDAVRNTMERIQSTPAPVAQEFTLNKGDYLIVSKFMAKLIGEKTRLGRPHHGIEILAVHRETEKAWLVDAKLKIQKTIHCAICGLRLTNKQSQILGIGPICADKQGISFEEGALEAVAYLLNNFTTNTVEQMWISKKSVKERNGVKVERKKESDPVEVDTARFGEY